MGRKSYFSLMAEGFKMMKQDPQAERRATLGEWTFIVRDGTFVFKTDGFMLKHALSSPLDIKALGLNAPGLTIERINEQNLVRIRVQGRVRLEAEIVCAESEWRTFLERMTEKAG